MNTVSGLTKRYGKRRVVIDLSPDITTGRVTGCAGPTAAPSAAAGRKPCRARDGVSR